MPSEDSISAGFIARSKDSYNPNGTARSLFTWTEPHATGKGNVMTVTPRPHCYQGCKSDEEKPAMSSRGNYVAYVAQMSEFCFGYHVEGERPDCPAFQDVFITYMGNSHEGHHLG